MLVILRVRLHLLKQSEVLIGTLEKSGRARTGALVMAALRRSNAYCASELQSWKAPV